MKDKLKTLITWIKLHWTYLVSGVVVIICIVFTLEQNSKAANLLNSLNISANQHKQDLVRLQQIQRENSEREARIEATYRETISKIVASRTLDLQTINNSQKDQVRAIVEQNQDDPTKMALEINELFGIPIY